MGVTDNYDHPFPGPTDFVQLGPAQIQALAESIDAKHPGYGVGTLAARPVSTPGSPGIAGRRYFATDAVAEYIDTGTAWARVGLEAGTIVATFRATAPAGYLLCDGGAIANSGATVELFAAVGGTRPDLRGRVPVGVDGAAGRLDALDALGNAGGAQKHTLTVAEMPSHTHTSMYFVNDSGGVGGKRGTATASNAGSEFGTGDTGGGGAHNNMPPYQVVNWMIKI